MTNPPDDATHGVYSRWPKVEITDEDRRLTRRQVCTIYDVPPWLVGGEPGYTASEAVADYKWWVRTWPRRKYRLIRGWVRRRVLRRTR